MASPSARRNTSIAASVFYFLSIPFLILVIIGNTHKGSAILTDIYFFQLDVSHIIPISVDNANLLNSVARSLGLHDFYQIGIWNFCEGYNDECVRETPSPSPQFPPCDHAFSPEKLLLIQRLSNRGVTFCSEPKQWFWFNPVEVLVSELLSGAQIALPSQAVTILKLLKLGSQIMYGFFIAGICVNLCLIFLTPLVIRTRWWSLLLTLLGAIAGVLVTVAAIIATVISIAVKIALTAQDQLNISANIGIKMFIFMWIAAVFTDVAFLLHAAMGCCCRPQHRQRNQDTPTSVEEEKRTKSSLPSFVRRRRGQGTS